MQQLMLWYLDIVKIIALKKTIYNNETKYLIESSGLLHSVILKLI